MNEPETKTPAESDEIDLQQELTDLRRSSSLLLLAMVVMSLTLSSFLWLQARRSGNDLKIMRSQVLQVQEANRREAPAIQNFVARLYEYGQNDAEFGQILAKYNIRMATNAGPTGAGPVPAAR
jgi:hypothetical protein